MPVLSTSGNSPWPTVRPSNLFGRGSIHAPRAYRLFAHMDRFRPETFLPLTPVAFEILLALADGARHGYSIMREVDERSRGAVRLHPGTLYRALARLLESELIEELDDPPAFARTPAGRVSASAPPGATADKSAGKPDRAHDDERRRYYRLTDRGIAVAKAEAERLAKQLEAARQRKLLKVRM